MAIALKAISLEVVHKKLEVWQYSQQAGEQKTTSNKCFLPSSLHSNSSLLEFWIHDKANVKREKKKRKKANCLSKDQYYTPKTFVKMYRHWHFNYFSFLTPFLILKYGMNQAYNSEKNLILDIFCESHTSLTVVRHRSMVCQNIRKKMMDSQIDRQGFFPFLSLSFFFFFSFSFYLEGNNVK